MRLSQTAAVGVKLASVLIIGLLLSAGSAAAAIPEADSGSPGLGTPMGRGAGTGRWE